MKTRTARVTTVHPDAETLGDWNAEPGSEPWCKALRSSLQNVVKSIAIVPEKVADYVDRAEEHHAWEHWKDADGKPFPDFKTFCAAPQPYGLGRPYATIRPFVDAVSGVAEAGEPREWDPRDFISDKVSELWTWEREWREHEPSPARLIRELRSWLNLMEKADAERCAHASGQEEAANGAAEA
ncbi:MAG TPA: hypothetical protein VK841_13830 [Polyangiaceae bacterium]|jgi:hypothetical protein|nr:hypothetical protein [Polyangiaceae bacterium]